MPDMPDTWLHSTRKPSEISCHRGAVHTCPKWPWPQPGDRTRKTKRPRQIPVAVVLAPAITAAQSSPPLSLEVQGKRPKEHLPLVLQFFPGMHRKCPNVCQTAPKIDPQSASNFDPLELSVMASPRGRGGGSLLASVFEPPAVVAGLDDLAMMGHPIQERRGHLGVAKDLAPLAKGQVGRHQDRRPFVEL